MVLPRPFARGSKPSEARSHTGPGGIRVWDHIRERGGVTSGRLERVV